MAVTAAAPRLAMARLLALLLVLLAPLAAAAKVERVEVLERVPFADGKPFGATGAYELVVARVHYAVDPADPANAAIADLALAPRDARGLVVFTGDAALLRPVDPARGNGTLLYEVTNRGGIGILGQLHGSPPLTLPRTAAHAGNGFLLEAGFTLLWSGWTWDIEAGREALRLDTPVVADPSAAGPVAYEFVPDAGGETATWTGLRAQGYGPADPADPAARLTVRDTPRGERRTIPRDRWAFEAPEGQGRPTLIRLQGGFTPGAIYEVVFMAEPPRVEGLGLAAIRDLLSAARTDGVAGAPPPDHVLLYGISQSGRLIAHMLWQGLHVDAAGRMVFDGAVIHVAGGGKGSFNHRYAQTTRHFSQWEDHGYPTDFFPFSTAPSTDPANGRTASLLDAAIARGAVPKLFITNSSAEYWNRAASLVHTTPDGLADLAPHPLARVYHIAGGQHFVSRSHTADRFANCVNPLDHQPLMRALLLALRDWVATGAEPPPSAVPRRADGTLVDVAAYRTALPALPGTVPVVSALQPARLLAGVPPGWGQAYPALVPAADADGNDRGGIRLPAIAVPLGTHTGWNLRHPSRGAPEGNARWEGSFAPFARTAAERAATADPRPSLADRYAGRDAYLAAYRRAADDLAARRLLREVEVDGMVAAAGGFWDRLHARDTAAGCAWMFAPP